MFLYLALGALRVDLFEKLEVLADSAKFDVACTSSGNNRSGTPGMIGNAVASGICHSFAADGRCISLLKVLMTNVCVFDCQYCANRASNDIKRAAFTPNELADLTIQFYRRNYIEGLFLSSGVIQNPDYTCERMIETLRLLREDYGFAGYIHAKAIPGASERLIARLGTLSDRLSVNIELPSEKSLVALAPDKSKLSILRPMGLISELIKENRYDLVHYRRNERFSPAGQSTQLIIGATGESDFEILRLTAALYKKYDLKRVFFSAYVPVSDNPLLPALTEKPPLLREHRMYQADWLLRFYGFTADELLDEAHANFNPLLDPKCNWALNNLGLFPIEVNKAPRELLLRVPGIGTVSANRIVKARRAMALDFQSLKKLGVVLKRAQYFLTCGGRAAAGLKFSDEALYAALVSEKCRESMRLGEEQMSFFDTTTREDVRKCLSGQM
jgi:putative DNA modification/repair radical SAM protein